MNELRVTDCSLRAIALPRRVVLRRMAAALIVGVVVVASAALPEVTSAQDVFSGTITLEARAYPSSGLYPEQHDAFASVVFEPDFYWTSEGGGHAFSISGFGRLDGGDDERSHVDLREAFWRTFGDVWELEVGLLRTFWGVTESQHLVDIVNQTDQVENTDGEDKLGQPAVHGTWLADFGTIDVYVMPLFRERSFPGAEGRFRFPLLIDTEAAEVERTLGVAARWFHFLGPLDLGLSYFFGTSREPRFRAAPASAPTAFVPVYERVHQASVDAQLNRDGWLWKLEAITRSGQGERFYAMTGGFEYTLGNIGSSGVDLGLISEYSHDTREADFSEPLVALSLFDNDIFLGSRVALNDVQSTEFLGGAVLDIEYGSISWLIEASRRVGDSFTAELEVRAASRVDPMDPLYLFRRDDHAQLGVSWYF